MSENVTLWQKEKTRILKEHNETIQELREELEKVKAQKETLKHKLEDQGDTLKMEKMKMEINKKRSSAGLPLGRYSINGHKSTSTLPIYFVE